MLSEFNVTINFFELFAKKFAKTGENRLFNNKKTLKSALCKAFFESFKFQTGRGSRTRTHINGFGDRYLSLWTIPLSAR